MQYCKSPIRGQWRPRGAHALIAPVYPVLVVALASILCYSNAVGQDREAGAATVETVKPERASTGKRVSLVGHIEPWNQAVLYSKVSGYLEWIGVDIGSWVKEGEVIARIDDPEMRADSERLRADAGAKRSVYDRLAAAQKDNPDMVSQLEVDRALGEVQSAEAALRRVERLVEYAQITAPFDGVITDRWVDPGALIQVATSSQASSARIVRIMEFDTARVAVSVPEPDCPDLRRGANAIVRASELPGAEFIGQVARFAWAIDPTSRTMAAEVDVPNPNHELRPGMYAVVEIALEETAEVLRLPSEAILLEGGKCCVWTVNDGQAYRVEVTVKNDDGVYAEIANGLTGSESVVRQGHQGLTEGATVKSHEVIQSATD